MRITKQILPENWTESVSLFTEGNKGRLMSISLCNIETIIEEIPLMSVHYESQFKGRNMIISTGMNNLKMNHIISSPSELWETKNETGHITSMEIIDYNNNEYILTFSNNK